jgi:hypothetical protein
MGSIRLGLAEKSQFVALNGEGTSSHTILVPEPILPLSKTEKMNFLHQSLSFQPHTWGLDATIFLHLTTKYEVGLVRIGGESLHLFRVER